MLNPHPHLQAFPEPQIACSPRRGFALFFRVAESLYARAVTARNARYDRTGPTAVPPVPVISIGNLTAGGTGKTPFVIHVVHRLEKIGRRPAVLLRGYRSRDGELSDEQRLIRRSCPRTVCVGDANRARAAETATTALGADVLVLDDGFQHRRLARNLDVVLIDATCPFGGGRLLPHGRLREPLTALRRADLLVLTRCDQVPDPTLAGIEAELRRLAPDVPHVKCVHRVIGLERLGCGPYLEPLRGKRAVLFAGIASPAAFVATARTLGVQIVGARWFTDHHVYRPRDLDRLCRKRRFSPHDLLLTTGKDAVKLATLPGMQDARIVVVHVGIDLLDDGGTIVQTELGKALRRA